MRPSQDAGSRQKAARALEFLQKTRKPGQKHNRVHQILAGQLGEISRRSGQPICRRRRLVMRKGEPAYVEGGGPFCDFLELVLKSLQHYLRQRQLAAVTVATIVRLVTDDFPKVS